MEGCGLGSQRGIQREEHKQKTNVGGGGVEVDIGGLWARNE